MAAPPPPPARQAVNANCVRTTTMWGFFASRWGKAHVSCCVWRSVIPPLSDRGPELESCAEVWRREGDKQVCGLVVVSCVLSRQESLRFTLLAGVAFSKHCCIHTDQFFY